MQARVTAVYRIRSDATSVAARAQAIALEQSIEVPTAAVADRRILDDIAGEVLDVRPVGDGVFEARIGLAPATTGPDAGQLLNMLFGNTSLHDDVTLQDLELPDDLTGRFSGPHHGLDGLRRRVGAGRRALTCSALKPQGMPADDLAALAERFALGGLDYIKDDHGLADQAYSPFRDRVSAVTRAVRSACQRTGRATRYLPSLSGDLDQLRRQTDHAIAEGVDTVLVAPMIAGVATFETLVRSYPDVAFVTHPTMAGAARIAPAALFGKLFRLLGADAVIFPNQGGRFGYSSQTCRDLAHAALKPWHGFRSSVPMPAGGMTLERVPEMLNFYGTDVMLLIGGGLLLARERLVEETAAFVHAVGSSGDRQPPGGAS